MRIRKLIARIYDLPNAFRVLDIMDEAGCDIEQTDHTDMDGRPRWRIVPKWYVSEEEARDLRRIILHKHQYKERSPLWKKIVFREFREGCRILPYWV